MKTSNEIKSISLKEWYLMESVYRRKGVSSKFSGPRLNQGEWGKYIDWKFNDPEGNIYVKFYDR